MAISESDSGYSIFQKTYPKTQLDGSSINGGIEMVDVFVTVVEGYQKHVYNVIASRLVVNSNTDDKVVDESDPNHEVNIEERTDDTGGGFGYTVLQRPIEALNIVFPHESLIAEHGIYNEYLSQNKELIPTLVGKAGLRRTFDYVHILTPTPFKGKFKYKPKIEEKFGRFLQQDKLGQYSQKMKSICDKIGKSDGIIMIYSQYIDGSLVPMALALEEMGFRRYGKHGATSLFDEPIDEIDYRSVGHTKSTHDTVVPARYVMITGDKSLSFTNNDDIAAINNPMNSDGSMVRSF